MTDRENTTLTLKHAKATLEVNCPLLAIIAPADVYCAKRWDCGPRTFDFLLEWLLDGCTAGDFERDLAVKKVLEGKWELHYRDVPIRRGDAITPEDRLWPA